MEYDTDILIIGAGPAGLAAAKTLSLIDASFILIHRETSPCETKACGGFIPARALERFDLDNFKGAYPVDAVRIRFPGTEAKLVEFNQKLGVNATRYHLGRAQLASIQDSQKIWPETKATRIEITRDSCITRIARNGEDGVIESKMLIDASGANPVSQRFAPIRGRIPNTAMGYAVQYQMRLAPESDTLRGVNDFIYGSEFSPGGYAWSFPRGREVAIGTGGLIDRVRKSEKRAEELLHHLITTDVHLRSEVGKAIVYKRESALMPLAGIVRPSYAHRIILAGDAAGHCSPITGEGIFYSMIAGELAAITAKESIQRNAFSVNEIAKYEKRWIKEFGSDLKWGLWLQRRFLKEGSKSIGSAFLSTQKSLKLIAEMLLGMRSVRSTIMRSAPSYVRSRLGI